MNIASGIPQMSIKASHFQIPVHTDFNKGMPAFIRGRESNLNLFDFA